MKKGLWIIPLLMTTLCGCSKMTVNGSSAWSVIGYVRNREAKTIERINELSANTIALMNVTEQLVTRNEENLNQLDTLLAQTDVSISTISTYGEDASSNDILGKSGIYEQNGFAYFFIDNIEKTNTSNTWDKIEPLKPILGDDFISKAKALKNGERIETNLNGFGLVAMRYQKEHYQSHSTIIGIVNSGLSFKDTAMQNKIERLCGDDLVLQTVSCNDNTQYVELGYPSQTIAQYVLGVPFPTVYYQLTMDREGNFKDLKMIITQDIRYVDTTEPLSDDVYARLATILTEVNGDKPEISLLKADIENTRSTGRTLSGAIDSLNYHITKEEGSLYSVATNLIVVHFNK